MEFTVVRQIS